MKNEAYLAWIRKQPSVISGQTGCEAHHCIGRRYSTSRTSDLLAFPLTPIEHANLHRMGWKEWESLYIDQRLYALQTLQKAIEQGFFTQIPQEGTFISIPKQALRSRYKQGLRGVRKLRESTTAAPTKQVPRSKA